MNGLAFEHYVDLPARIFQSWQAEFFHGKLREAVIAAEESGRSLDPVTLARLQWYPSLLSSLVAEGRVSIPDLEKMLKPAWARFHVMANDYDGLAPLLEAKLLDDPESAERIIRWRRFRNRPTFRPEEEYLRALGDDPNRHYRLTPPGARPEREVMSAMAVEKRLVNPAWAYLFVSCTAIGELSDDIVSVLSESEEYSYLTALVLRKRGLPAAVWEPVLHAISSPRWAFHALRDLDPGVQIEPNIVNRLFTIVHKSPPWAVQVWHDRGFRGDVLQWGYTECSHYAADHECLPELHSWYRFQRAVSGRRVAA